MKNLVIILRILLVLLAFICVQYSFAQVYNFTSAGATGRTGPGQAQVNAAYINTSLHQKVISASGIQSWTVPLTGPYRIIAAGAQGGGNGGFGAQIQGDFVLTAGDVLHIAVGQKGEDGTGASVNGGGGGGGSFVIMGQDSILLIAAGGGGGLDTLKGANGSTLTSGGSTIWNGAGTNGNGGHSGITNGDAAGGGGFYTDGENSFNIAQNTCEGGKAFLNGAEGGKSGNCGNYYGGAGGFGGGGSGWHNGINRCGGGGGYSGGQGGTLSGSVAGGGGGSLNKGTSQDNKEGAGSQDGWVKISLINTNVTTIAEQQVAERDAIAIFPNPTNGVFAVTLNDKTKATPYRLCDMEGKTVAQGNLLQETFDISTLDRGVYYLEAEGFKTKKIVKL